jgi:hypothetical protein
MDHPCHKCAQSVEDGVPFCSHCGAPQIRVAVAEVSPARVVSLDEASPLPTIPLEKHSLHKVALPVRWPQTLRPCALAALASVLMVTLRLYPLVAMFGAGMLAVVFHRQRNPGTVVSAGMGARLGALSGLLGFGMLAGVGALAVAVFQKGPEIRNLMIETIRQAASQTADQQAQAMLTYLGSAAGFPALILLNVVAGLFAAIVLATLGGALAGAFFARRGRS